MYNISIRSINGNVKLKHMIREHGNTPACNDVSIPQACQPASASENVSRQNQF
jgi:hypothetical protein